MGAGADTAGVERVGVGVEDVGMEDVGVEDVGAEDAEGEDGAESANSVVEVEGAVAEAERNPKASGVPSAWRRRL